MCILFLNYNLFVSGLTSLNKVLIISALSYNKDGLIDHTYESISLANPVTLAVNTKSSVPDATNLFKVVSQTYFSFKT